MTNDTMLTALGRTTSSDVKTVMWLLAEIGQACVRFDMGGQFGGNKEAAYLQKNPNGIVAPLRGKRCHTMPRQPAVRL